MYQCLLFSPHLSVNAQCLQMWGLEYKTFLHHYFPSYQKANVTMGIGEGGQKRYGRRGNRRNAPGPLEKNKHQPKELLEKIISSWVSTYLGNRPLNEHNFLQIRKTQFVLTRCCYDQGTKLIGNSTVIV